MKNKLILNRIFTKNTFENLINNTDDTLYSCVIKRYLKTFESKPNFELISEIYKFMNSEYRNEYVYKNTLLNKLLLGRHSLNTTTALTEIPISKSKADFILINGKGVVYEIKTELDNFERLENQINDYYKAFNHVCVVTCKANIEKLEKVLKNDNVGICVLNKNNSISTIKKPMEYNSCLDYKTMFNILRKPEYENIILNNYKKLPQTTQFKYYDECFQLFKQLNLNLAHKEMLKQLKNRSKIEVKEYKEYVPYELRSLVYFAQYKHHDYLKLDSFLKSNFKG
ncbi:sce7726 family protein [Clostridioides difficile]